LEHGLRFSCENKLISVKFLHNFCEIPTFQTCPLVSSVNIPQTSLVYWRNGYMSPLFFSSTSSSTKPVSYGVRDWIHAFTVVRLDGCDLRAICCLDGHLCFSQRGASLSGCKFLRLCIELVRVAKLLGVSISYISYSYTHPNDQTPKNACPSI